MIQQEQSTTTTNKYNFPLQNVEDPTLPTRFIELSIRTIRNVTNQTALYQSHFQKIKDPLDPTEEIEPNFIGKTKIKLNQIQLEPSQRQSPVVAIDVSSIKIGETTTGILLALRGAIVRKDTMHYNYLRIGPFPFHITEENKAEITQLFRKYSFDFLSPPENNPIAPSLIHIQTSLTTQLERWLLTRVINQSQDTIILLDGSLTAGTPDTPVSVLAQLLQNARNRLNAVLAFSKMTRLRLQGTLLTDLTERCKPPCLMEIDGYPTEQSADIHLLGNIYVAKLGKGNNSFRLDIDKKLDHDQAIEVTKNLMASEILSESYPESLRLAHIYSTFTANEVIGIQSFLAKTYGIRTVTRPNIRRILFGPYGKGPEGA